MATTQVTPPSFISRHTREARRFYLNLTPLPGREPAVVCGGWERCTPDYRVQRERFPYLSVEFVMGGGGELDLAGEHFRLQRGTVFTYGPECPHEIVTDEKNCLSKYFVDFVGEEALALMSECGLPPGTCKTVAQADEVQSAFEQLLLAGSRITNSTARITALQLQILLLQIIDSGLPSEGNYQSYQTFLRCRSYLDDRFLELKTAEEAAAACHVDPAYLSRLFSRYSSEAPYRYLLRKKMMWAANLLDGGNLIIREVAEKIEMDPFHFSRVFKRIYGMSPASFIARRGTLGREG